MPNGASGRGFSNRIVPKRVRKRCACLFGVRSVCERCSFYPVFILAAGGVAFACESSISLSLWRRKRTCSEHNEIARNNKCDTFVLQPFADVYGGCKRHNSGQTARSRALTTFAFSVHTHDIELLFFASAYIKKEHICDVNVARASVVYNTYVCEVCVMSCA